MTTALDVIKRSMRLLGVYDIGEEPTADEAQDALTALNTLTQQWSTGRGFIFAETEDVIPMVANQPLVTVGPSGTFPTARPVKILDQSYMLYSGVKFPLSIWTESEYNRIIISNIGGIPIGIWPHMTFPDIEIRPWPLPADAMELHLWSQKAFASFPTLTTNVELPPGYEKMLAFCLAEDIAPEFMVEPSPTVVRQAANARRMIKRINAVIPRLDMPYGIPGNWNGNYGWWGAVA